MNLGHDLRIIRCFETAKNYLTDRYAEYPESRYGLVASSRDKFLQTIGIPNEFRSRQRIKMGPWYNDDKDHPLRLSCKHLEISISEFEAQGLELDAVLLAWGTDFMLEDVKWSIEKAMRSRKPVKDPFQLLANTYRVLLTRARDAHVIFVPEPECLDETWSFLCKSGLRPLTEYHAASGNQLDFHF